MEFLNEKIKKLYIEWIEEQKSFVTVYTNDIKKVRWTLVHYGLSKTSYHRKSQGDSLGVSENKDFFKDFNKVNFLGTTKDWLNFGCVFDEETEGIYIKKLFFHIIDALNHSEKKAFLSMCTRLFSTNSVMGFTYDKKDLYKQWITTPPAAFASMMTHQEMSKFFTVFEHHYSKETDKETVIYNYLNTGRKRMLKRLETQHILKKYVEVFIKDQDKFSIFLTKVNNVQFFKSSGQVVAFNVDKSGFYNALNPSSLPIDKYDMTELLLAFMNYVNSSEAEKSRLFINQFTMLNKDSNLDYYTIVFDGIQNFPEINYKHFFEAVLPSCSQLIEKNTFKKNASRSVIADNLSLQESVFKSSITKYFIEIKLPKKSILSAKMVKI